MSFSGQYFKEKFLKLLYLSKLFSLPLTTDVRKGNGFQEES